MRLPKGTKDDKQKLAGVERPRAKGENRSGDRTNSKGGASGGKNQCGAHNYGGREGKGNEMPRLCSVVTIKSLRFSSCQGNPSNTVQ